MKNVFYKSLLLLTLSLTPAYAHASTMSFGHYIPQPELVNQTRLTHLFWDVYDIALYAPQGEYKTNAPFALEITYLMNLKGKDIAKVAKKEMRRLGMKDTKTLELWHQKMLEIFPDVQEGERLVGIKGADGYTYFYNDSQFIGSVQDHSFSQYFFDIWLSPETSRPDLRRKLLKSNS